MLQRASGSLLRRLRTETRPLLSACNALRLYADDAASKKGGGRADKDSDIYVAALSPQPYPPTPEHTAADAERAKKYSRMKMAEHRRQQLDFKHKIELMKAAVAALPTQELRDAAMEPDLSHFPAKRTFPLITPQQESYLESKQASAEAGSLTGKRR